MTKFGRSLVLATAAMAALAGACGGGDDDGDTKASGASGGATTTVAVADAAAGAPKSAQVCKTIGLARLKALLPDRDPKVAEPYFDTGRPGVVSDACSYKIGTTSYASITLTHWESVDQARTELPHLLFKPTAFTGLGDEAMKGNDGNGGAGAAARFGSRTIDVELGEYSELNDAELAKAETFLRAVAQDLAPLLK